MSYSKERVQFGKPIAKFQSVGNMLADMTTEIYAARQMLYQTSWLRDQGKQVIKEASMARLDTCLREGREIVEMPEEAF